MTKFKIKISDLLKEPGKSDTLTFEEFFPEQLHNLGPNGIKGSLILVSLDDSTIMVTLENISCELEDFCDRCTKAFTRSVICETHKAKFLTPDQKSTEDDEIIDEEELFPIDDGQNINIEEMIIQSIMLQEPITKRCAKCANLPIEDDDSEEENYFKSNDNIIFR